MAEKQTPTTGVHIDFATAKPLFAKHLLKDITALEDVCSGFNNRSFFVTCSDGSEFVLRLGGRHWRKFKTVRCLRFNN